MSHPPANPPPFDQPMIRKCIKTNVRIQNQEGLQEVLILTTVLCSVESELNRNDTAAIIAADNETFQPSDGSSSDEEMYSDSSEDSRGDSDGNVNEPQDRVEEHRMKAFWLRKDPICEVRFSCPLLSAYYWARILNNSILTMLYIRIITVYGRLISTMPKSSKKQIYTGYPQTTR